VEFSFEGNIVHSLMIGGSQYGENFQGLIDEVHIYNRAPTNTEIQAIYQQAAINLPVDFAISNSDDRSVYAGHSVTDTISDLDVRFTSSGFLQRVGLLVLPDLSLPRLAL